ncbi:vacuolar protein 14 C-terminal Fig4p binding-domain-containing protein [Spinellus fusiger]|nr:vacuolar protein 14 C-terminal Fig4p binding-domain-containing protein [Spinellus fusiger]
MDTELFSAPLVRALTDKVYERRKGAALQIERLVRERDRMSGQVTSIIETLVQDFVYSNNPNARNGGLIALAATAIALGPAVACHLDRIIPPTVSCFNNPDSRVRYYACESMYNIAKVAKGEVLRFFNSIFDALCMLSEDTELSVKSGAELLDRLIKDIVCELSIKDTSPRLFSLAQFVPLLSSKLDTVNSPTRQYLVSWISTLNSIPELDLVHYVHEFLGGLLQFLGDANEELRTDTHAVLYDLLGIVQELREMREAADTQDTQDTQDTLESQPTLIEYERIVEILVPYLTSSADQVQHLALQWLNECLFSAKECVLQFTPQILLAILPSLSHPVEAIRSSVMESHHILQQWVMEALEKRTSEDPFDFQATVAHLRLQFLNEHEETRIASLDWLLMLYKKAPKKILVLDDGTFPMLLKTLSDASEEVVRRDLQLLAQISSHFDYDYFRSFMMDLVSLFSTDQRLLETRGSLIIRQLCISLDPERIYMTLADVLEKDEDLEFASIMVQNLNVILLTSTELVDLRQLLRHLDTKEGQRLFIALYKSWCHNAVATFSLCLLAQAYGHGANLLQVFAELEMTVNTLIQIDKLVQLLESPVFTYLRLQLLEPEKYPHLSKCLYGLLMLLPQSSAFSTLRSRLGSVSSLVFLHAMKSPVDTPKRQPSKGTSNASAKGEEAPIKFQELLQHFKQVQCGHERHRKIGNCLLLTGIDG